jgi:hypothetical protein
MEALPAIQQITLVHRRYYGYRRISAEWRRWGVGVNRKRVMRIVTEDNLLGAPSRHLQLPRIAITNSKYIRTFEPGWHVLNAAFYRVGCRC